MKTPKTRGCNDTLRLLIGRTYDRLSGLINQLIGMRAKIIVFWCLLAFTYINKPLADKPDMVAVLTRLNINAMMYSEDAPVLEKAFHKHFGSKQVNRVNPRKEFFGVSLDGIEKYATANGLKTEFTKIAEAKEYRETMLLCSG